ncbi:MAG: type IV pili twitching motility protein PilT, partial [Oligoflexia bacterium]
MSSAQRASLDQSSISLEYLVTALVKFNASDLHLKAGRPPIYRINGKLVPAKMRPLSAAEVNEILLAMLTSRQRKDLDLKLQVDLSVRFGELGRFRCNIYYQRGSLSAAIRMIPVQIPRLEDLGAPLVLKELAQRQHGILLI